MPAFSLLYRPALLPVYFLSVQNAPLPLISKSTASVDSFSPGYTSAQVLLTSELLRTLLMYGCF